MESAGDGFQGWYNHKPLGILQVSDGYPLTTSGDSFHVMGITLGVSEDNGYQYCKSVTIVFLRVMGITLGISSCLEDTS